jgi:hypothetical protein
MSNIERSRCALSTNRPGKLRRRRVIPVDGDVAFRCRPHPNEGRSGKRTAALTTAAFTTEAAGRADLLFNEARGAAHSCRSAATGLIRAARLAGTIAASIVTIVAKANTAPYIHQVNESVRSPSNERPTSCSRIQRMA